MLGYGEQASTQSIPPKSARTRQPTTGVACKAPTGHLEHVAVVGATSWQAWKSVPSRGQAGTSSRGGGVSHPAAQMAMTTTTRNRPNLSPFLLRGASNLALIRHAA